MHPTRPTPLAAALALCIVAGCASFPVEGAQALMQSQSASSEGVVEVRNDGREDVILYLDRDGMRHRLGRVSRMETARFAIPRGDGRASAHLSLIARPVGSGNPYATAPLLWHPGQSLTARLGTNSFQRTFDLVIR